MKFSWENFRIIQSFEGCCSAKFFMVFRQLGLVIMLFFSCIVVDRRGLELVQFRGSVGFFIQVQQQGGGGVGFQVDLYVVDVFGLCVYYEEVVIEVLFGFLFVGQEGFLEFRFFYFSGDYYFFFQVAVFQWRNRGIGREVFGIQILIDWVFSIGGLVVESMGGGGLLVFDFFFGIFKGFSETGEVRVEVGGRGDDFQEFGMDFRGEFGGQEGIVGVQFLGIVVGIELSYLDLVFFLRFIRQIFFNIIFVLRRQ